MEFPKEHLDKVAADHNLVWDPPAAMTSVRRWTCDTCGRAVLVNGYVVYGSATSAACQS